MRLHTLRLHAVGPFADEQAVDFDRLGSGGLFLFEGPTGVGKSTILDAITFALYGGLASDAADPGRMRSDFADPMATPEVVLEFSVRGQRYRVTRSPEHQRPKRRGTGVTTERTRVHLERSGPDGWATLSHSKEEVGALVTDLVGLSREQFRQVVLLPQGEFATFLRADDDRRREVLMKLFGTQFFRRVTDQLQGRAQAARAALAEADTELGARVSAAWEAAGRDPGDALVAGEASLSQRVDQVDALAEGIAQAADRTAQVLERCVERVATAGSERLAAAQLLELVDRRTGLMLALDQHEAGREAHDRRVQRLARARLAEPVGPLLELLADAQQEVEAARAELTDLGAAVEAMDASSGEALTAAAAELRTTAAGLAHVAGSEAALPGLRAELVARGQAAEQLADERRMADERARCLPQLSLEAREALDGARAVVARREELAQRGAVLGDRLAAANRVVELTARMNRAREDQRTARRAHDQARDTVELLTEHRLDDLRGLLAGQLVSGDPCLVCGSCEHPAPAAARTVGVTDEQVRAAVALRDQAHVELEAAELALARSLGELQAAEVAAGDSTVTALDEELRAVTARQAEVERAEASLPTLVERLEELAHEEVQLNRSLLDLTDQLSGQRAAAGRLADDLARIDAEVAAARAGFPTVQDRIDDLDRRARAATRRAAALIRLSGAEAERDRVAARAGAQARAAGFADAGEAQQALLAPDALRALAAEVELWKSELESLSRQAAAPELAEVAGLERASVEQRVLSAQEAVVAREQDATDARREAAVAAQRRDRFAERRAEVHRAHADRIELAARSDEIIALDQYARGMAGSPRMTLVTFVLRYWFEQVVAAANVRLAEMSAGKYQLVRLDESSRRDARVGLGLAVLDRHTGRERSTSTLSGGETFYTSLALALGLADVVVAQAGGAQLDTLFIDEGFGSLDPDTLDDVMAVIDDLRGNGRVVGIVSHVPDLKERISERLSVRRVRPDGPSEIRVLA